MCDVFTINLHIHVTPTYCTCSTDNAWLRLHAASCSVKHQAPLSCPVASVKVYKITMYYIYGVQACMLSLICNAYIQCQMGAVLKHYFLKSYLQHTYMCFDCVALYSYIIMHLEIDLFSLQCALKTTSLMLQSIRHILLCYVSWLHTHTCWKLQLEIAHKHALEQWMPYMHTGKWMQAVCVHVITVPSFAVRVIKLVSVILHMIHVFT